LFKKEQLQVHKIQYRSTISTNLPCIGNTGKDVIKLMLTNQADPIDIVKEKGWMRIVDPDQLEALCKEIITKNAEKVGFICLLIYLSNYYYRPSPFRMEIQNYLNGLLVKPWVVQKEWQMPMH
jgi:hypothetical protein